MVTDTTLAVDATGGGGGGGVATGVGVVGDEPRPQAIDKARITTPNESLFIMILINSRKDPKTRPVATSADCWPLSANPHVDRCDSRRCVSLRQAAYEILIARRNR